MSFKLFSSSLIRRLRLYCTTLCNISDEDIFVDSYPAIKCLELYFYLNTINLSDKIIINIITIYFNLYKHDLKI